MIRLRVKARGVLLVFASLFCSSSAMAQQAERQAAKEGQDAYDNGDYVAALHKLERAEEGVSLLEPSEQVVIYRYHAYCLVVLDRKGEAELEFHKMLEADPEITLDPAVVPPKIVAAFQQARKSWKPLTPGRAGMYSAFLPGLGQWKEGRKTPALEFAAGTVVVLGLAVYGQTLASTAEQYASQAGPNEKSTFNSQALRYDLQRDVLVAGLVAVWVGAALDARSHAPFHLPRRVAVVPRTGDAPGLLLAVRF